MCRKPSMGLTREYVTLSGVVSLLKGRPVMPVTPSVGFGPQFASLFGAAKSTVPKYLLLVVVLFRWIRFPVAEEDR